MHDNELNQLVLDKIKEINIDRPADQSDLLESLPLNNYALITILNRLYNSGLISADRRDVEPSNSLIAKGFSNITANYH